MLANTGWTKCRGLIVRADVTSKLWTGAVVRLSIAAYLAFDRV